MTETHDSAVAPAAGRRHGSTGCRRVLLTTSAAPVQSPFSTREKRPPLGLGFLISMLRGAGHEVFFIDNYLQPSDFLETGYLQDNAIDVVGIYANTICLRDTLRMLRRLQQLREERRWKGKIVVGGPHASVAPETIPGYVDHIVQGEGEYALRDIVAGKTAERIVRHPRIESLDELPMPAWDCFVGQPYNWGVDFFDNRPVFTMNTSRGCPFQCTFCSVGSIWGKRYTCFSADRIVSDIEYVIQNHGAQGIYFREDNFTLDEKRLRRFCELLMDRGLRIPWVCESRVSTLTRERVELMARAGLRGFYFGVESGSPRILDRLRKGITTEQIENAFRWCHEFGVGAAASVVMGVPGETKEDLAATRDLLQRIRPTVVWPNVFVGIPDSELYRHVLDNRLYEYIDDRGLVYLPGHDERVRQYYGEAGNACVAANGAHEDPARRPRVSVLMAVHNGQRYLREAMESVYRQTFQDFEVVVVDDGSTDQTPEILREWKDPRMLIWRNGVNQGLTKSLNQGLSLCHGEYVARMDADDLSAPGRLAAQVAFLDRHREIAMVGTPYHCIDADGSVTASIQVPTGDREIKERLKEKNCFGHGTVMARRDVLTACGGYDEWYTYAQDYDLWLRLAEKHRLANLDEPLYYWRSTDQGVSTVRRREQEWFRDRARRQANKRRARPAPVGSKRRSSVDTKPLVSVIVPTYDRPEALKRTLVSVLLQTYENVEIVVVNDAGVDVEDIVRWLRPRGTIIHLRHNRNKGLAAARNTGIRAAHGKYIAYLDDDDIYFRDHLERLATALEGSDHRVAYTEAVRSHQERRGGAYVEVERTKPYRDDVTHEGLLVRNLVPVLCVMHEKACLDEVGCFDETLPTHEDWDLWIRMSRRFRFLHIPEATALVTWRTDGSTMTSRRTQMFLTMPEVIYRKYRDFAADKPDVLSLQSQRLRLLRSQAGAALPSGGTCDSGRTKGGSHTPGTRAGWERMTWNVAIKACTPSRDQSLWGDTWFAHGLAKAMLRAGHNCAVHFHDAWNQADEGIDLTVHVKGLARYTPKPHSFNVIWIISHPELHTPDELNEFDAVFCASRKYLECIQPQVRVPCFHLPQATDEEVFRPPDSCPTKDLDILFVGNNYYRDRRRRIIDDLLATGKDYNLSIVGLNWAGAVEERYVKGEYVHPQQLPGLYARAKIVLNDHHHTMRQWGFINDRTYNLAAVRAFQISDYVDGLEELGIVTYHTPDDLRRKLDYFLEHDEERERIAARVHDRCRDRTFTRAAARILDTVHDLKQASPAVAGNYGRPKTSIAVAGKSEDLRGELEGPAVREGSPHQALAELQRRYRAMPDDTPAKQALALRIAEMARRLRLLEQPQERETETSLTENG